MVHVIKNIPIEENHKVTDISKKILMKYGGPEEYLTDKYPSDYFSYFIDIGTRGIFNPWHINHIAANNPNMLCLGYEPDYPFYEELIQEVERRKLSNVNIHPEGFGTGERIATPQGRSLTVTLKDIFEKYKLDPALLWMFKIDAEGAEYALLKDECRDCVKILQQADHIAIEFHTSEHPYGNFFTAAYNLPSSFEVGENWLHNTFEDTHTILLTSAEPGLKTYVLLSDRIITDAKNLFWKDLLNWQAWE